MASGSVPISELEYDFMFRSIQIRRVVLEIGPKLAETCPYTPQIAQVLSEYLALSGNKCSSPSDLSAILYGAEYSSDHKKIIC